MPAYAGYDLVIISDLHMSAGYNRRTGTWDRNEDFFYDAALSRFIDHLLARASSESRRWRLVILGDLLDFLQVEPPKKRSAGLTSSATTVAKLERIAQGHAEAFTALGRLVAAGHMLDVVLGNHDIEFCWPEVQQRFKTLVAPDHDAQAIERISFHPWIFYVPGVVYAEHGHQYDINNSFATLLQPFLPTDPSVIELPLGSFFVLYLFNYIERIDPFADNIKPATRYLLWALRTRPVIVLSTSGFHLQFFLRVLRKTSTLSTQEQAERRATYRRDVLRTYAAQIGLPADLVEEIDRLAAVPALSDHWHQVRALVLEPLIPGIAGLAGFAALYRLALRAGPALRPLLMLGLGLGALIFREWDALRPTTQSGSYLYAAAKRIHEQLSRIDAAVPAYVFGHTHTAEQFPYADDDATPRYFNTGTWTPVPPHQFDLLGTRERFSFVQITRDPANEHVRAELLLWNDAANRSEPLPLLT